FLLCIPTLQFRQTPYLGVHETGSRPASQVAVARPQAGEQPSTLSQGQTYQSPAYQSGPKPTYQPNYAPSAPSVGPCAENGSCYGDLSNLTGRPKTVLVRGYFRKNGTYVRGHYRSH
ncbi:hypothetical protein P9272_23210, partial [Mesorhizobium sp. WSM4976]|uniref:hypothetical protein n=1 Tax=Mesorhizobium sp. WSM4976 TaxID=3038549 RepID=UPI0024161E4A